MERRLFFIALCCLGLSSQMATLAQGSSRPITPNDDPAVNAIYCAIGKFNEEAFKSWTIERDTGGIMWSKLEWRIAHQPKWKGNNLKPANKTLRRLWKALEKYSPKAYSAYYHLMGNESNAVKEMRIPVGSSGNHASVLVGNDMITYMLAFRTDPHYTTHFVMQWWEERESEASDLVILHAVISYFTSWRGAGKAPEEQKHNPALQKFLLKDLQELGFPSIEAALKSRIGGIETSSPDTSLIDQRWVSPYTLELLREEESRAFVVSVSHFDKLQYKLLNLLSRSRIASPTELAALALTLNKEADEYPSLLSPHELESLEAKIMEVKQITDVRNHAASPTIMQALGTLRAKLNRTPSLDNYSKETQEYLNDNKWHILKHDLGHDHLIQSGAHYLSDQLSYLNAESDSCAPYHAEHYEENLAPGIYRLSVVARGDAEHSGVFIFTKTGDGTEEKVQMAEILGCKNIGGPLWESAKRKVELAKQQDVQPDEFDIRASATNGGKGRGWNAIVIDSIEVKDGKLTYGISNIPEFTGSHMQGRWFSACDFVLQRVGDLPD